MIIKLDKMVEEGMAERAWADGIIKVCCVIVELENNTKMDIEHLENIHNYYWKENPFPDMNISYIENEFMNSPFHSAR